MARKNTARKNTYKTTTNSTGKGKQKSSGSFAFLNTKEFKTITGIFLLLFSFLFLIACISYLKTWKQDDMIFDHGFWNTMFSSDYSSENVSGKLGAWLAFLFIKRLFGVAAFLLIPLILIYGLRLLDVQIKRFRFYIFLLACYTIFFSVLLATIFPKGELLILGGTFGARTVLFFTSFIGKVGLILLLIFSAILLISITVPAFYFNMIEKIKNIKPVKDKSQEDSNISTNENQSSKKEEEKEEIHTIEESETTNEQGPIEFEITTVKDKKQETSNTESEKDTIPFEIIESDQHTSTEHNEVVKVENDTEQEYHGTLDTPYDPRKDLESYVFPGIDILRDHGSGTINIDKQELGENKNKIETTLHNYGISIEKIVATVGPTVTLYEIVPAPGVRISKIKNLEDDIALSLAALGIRIIAPIPGKGTIGIEVPNKNPETVSFKSLVVSPEFENTVFDLPIALGKTIDNKPYIADLSKMPHLLMAGATGQGKSVGLNTIIASLLYKKHPAELKFVLVDPKKVELPLFAKIERHFLAKLPDAEEAIITDTSHVVKTLKALTIEMDQRYDLLKDAQVRNIKEYNEKFISRKLNPNNNHKFLPYIVLIVDEFADLIMTAGKEVEGPIARIAQLARAVGIHLVIATQRPSVNIITGVIKANFPARMAFKVSAKVDSRTILDTSGADQLIGRGDMLLSNGSRIDRLQCAFIDTPELEEIAEFIGNQRAYPDAFQLPEVKDDENNGRKDYDSSDERDPMFEEAARVIVQNQHGSTSLIQRKLKLGYNRAGRLIDQLEAAGIVGPFEGSKAREVIIKDMDTLEQLLNSFNNN